MSRLSVAAGAGLFAASLLLNPGAKAAVVAGSAYLNNPANSNAVIGFSHGAADATFTVPSPTNPACGSGFTLCFSTGDSSATSLGAWLTGGGATILTGSPAALSAAFNNTVLEFTGTVTVTNGETFSVGHDDGLQLQIGSTMVINAPGPTGPTITTQNYTGPTGTFPFDLVYGECCGGPAELAITLPFVSAVPEPVSLALVGSGLIGLAAVRRRR